jgi:hypothetical protein
MGAAAVKTQMAKPSFGFRHFFAGTFQIENDDQKIAA